jgi:hypothetical protein
MRNKLWVLALLAASSVAAFAQIPLIGSTVNATVGYEIGGTAPSTHTLCGNGANYVDSATPCTSTTLFYQTVDANGTAQTQRPVLNFSSFFTLTDSSSPARSTVDPTHVGANATCNNPSSVVVDVYGRTTACASGSLQQTRAIHVTTQCSGSSNDCICTSTSSSFDECSVNLSFTASDAFPQATFATSFDGATCNATPSPINSGASNNGVVICFVSSGNTTGLTVFLQNLAGRPATVTDIWVTALGH